VRCCSLSRPGIIRGKSRSAILQYCFGITYFPACAHVNQNFFPSCYVISCVNSRTIWDPTAVKRSYCHYSFRTRCRNVWARGGIQYRCRIDRCDVGRHRMSIEYHFQSVFPLLVFAFDTISCPFLISIYSCLSLPGGAGGLFPSTSPPNH